MSRKAKTEEKKTKDRRLDENEKARRAELRKQKTEETRRRRTEWNRENIKSLSCRLRKEEAEVFKAYCDEHHTTPGSVLKAFVMCILEEYADKEVGQPGEQS